MTTAGYSSAPGNCRSPFGVPANHVCSLNVGELRAMYRAACTYDPARHFLGLERIDCYECSATGMHFWKPSEIAGDESFYAAISTLRPHYYRAERWEYARSRQEIGSAGARVLEVGCGRGFFLKSIERATVDAIGLELNNQAILDKVTSYPLYPMLIDDYAEFDSELFDCVCAFQVLEHVVEPMKFLLSAARRLRAGGKLIISTPNHEYPLHAARGDPFDLPPHHLNHFTPRVFSRIAKHLGFDLIAVVPQMITAPRYRLPLQPNLAPLHRFVRSCTNRLLAKVTSRMSPGHAVLAVFRT